MFSSTTQDIRVSVIPVYDVKNSAPSSHRFIFRYNVFIENFGAAPVRLLRRKWLIHDLGYGFSEVEGEGVIGLLPEIGPDNDFTYFSNVMLQSGMGYMLGTYLLENMDTGDTFYVEIPKFQLYAAMLAN